MVHLIYFSSIAENTHRFVARLEMPATRIPVRKNEPEFLVIEPFVLITPTYGNADVPHQVKKFLNIAENRHRMVGVVGAGNINFGENFARAADVISMKTGTPVLHKFELLGTPEDVQIVRENCLILST